MYQEVCDHIRFPSLIKQVMKELHGRTALGKSVHGQHLALMMMILKERKELGEGKGRRRPRNLTLIQSQVCFMSGG